MVKLVNPERAAREHLLLLQVGRAHLTRARDTARKLAAADGKTRYVVRWRFGFRIYECAPTVGGYWIAEPSGQFTHIEGVTP